MPCGALSGIVALDFDVPEGPKLYESRYDDAELPPTAMTPKGGYHALHAYQEGMTVPNDVKLIPGLDVRSEGGYVIIPSAYQDGRAWIVPPDKPAPPLPDWFLSCLNKPHAPAAQVTGVPDGLPAGVGQGERNQGAAKLAGRYLAKGLTAEETTQILIAWNRKNLPPLPEEEIRRIVFSIARKEREKSPGIEVISAGELARLELTSPPMLVEPFFPEGGKAILAGGGGKGKSLLANFIAFSIASEYPLFGRFKVNKANVLYIDRENIPPLVKARQEKIYRGLRAIRAGVSYSFPERDINLADPRNRMDICKRIENSGAKLVIFDSFLCFTQVRSESDNTEVRYFLNQVEEIGRLTGAAILFIDHTAKPSVDSAKARIGATLRIPTQSGHHSEAKPATVPT